MEILKLGKIPEAFSKASYLTRQYGDPGVNPVEGRAMASGITNSGKSTVILHGILNNMIDEFVEAWCSPEFTVQESMAYQFGYLLEEVGESELIRKMAECAYESKDIKMASGALVKIGNGSHILGDREALPNRIKTFVETIREQDIVFADLVVKDAFPHKTPTYLERHS